MSNIADPRSSQGYKPRFELWMNVFLHQALLNVVNSLSSLEVTTRSAQGLMISEVRVPVDRLIWNVRILDALLIDEWKIGDKVADYEAMVKDINIEDEPDRYFHQLVQLLQKRRMLRFKPPRSLAPSHD